MVFHSVPGLEYGGSHATHLSRLQRHDPHRPCRGRRTSSLTLTEAFGNPSSSHPYGKKAREAVELARTRVAALLGCDSAQVIFTGGGTESNNQALIGAAFANRDRGKHIISTTIEHPAVLNPLHWLEGQGFTVTCLPVDGAGRLDPETVRRAITGETILISVMHANNEVGTIQPLAEIGEIAREKGIIFHTDAAQSVGKIPTRVDDLRVDLLTVAGHKLYAPKGIGALFIRQRDKNQHLSARRRARRGPPRGYGKCSLYCGPGQGGRTGRTAPGR